MEKGINRGVKNGRDHAGHCHLLEFHVQATSDFKEMVWGHLTAQVKGWLMGRAVEGGRRAQHGRAGALWGWCLLPLDRGGKGIWMAHGLGRSDAASHAPEPAVSAPSKGWRHEIWLPAAEGLLWGLGHSAISLLSACSICHSDACHALGTSAAQPGLSDTGQKLLGKWRLEWMVY